MADPAAVVSTVGMLMLLWIIWFTCSATGFGYPQLMTVVRVPHRQHLFGQVGRSEVEERDAADVAPFSAIRAVMTGSASTP